MNHALDGGADPPRGKGITFVVATAFAAIEIIQYARQAQIVFRKFLGAGDEAYRPRRGWWDCKRGRSLMSPIGLLLSMSLFRLPNEIE